MNDLFPFDDDAEGTEAGRAPREPSDLPTAAYEPVTAWADEPVADLPGPRVPQLEPFAQPVQVPQQHVPEQHVPERHVPEQPASAPEPVTEDDLTGGRGLAEEIVTVTETTEEAPAGGRAESLVGRTPLLGFGVATAALSFALGAALLVSTGGTQPPAVASAPEQVVVALPTPAPTTVLTAPDEPEDLVEALPGGGAPVPPEDTGDVPVLGPAAVPDDVPAELAPVAQGRDPFEVLVSAPVAAGGATAAAPGALGGGGAVPAPAVVPAVPEGTSSAAPATPGAAPASVGAAGPRDVQLLDAYEQDGTEFAQAKIAGTIQTVAVGETLGGTFWLMAVAGDCATMRSGDEQFALCEGQRVVR